MMENEKPITKELILELWTKTYNRDGKPDWSHLFPYYDENIIFEDSIQRINGIEDFKGMCQRLVKRCEKLSMEILSIVKESQDVFFQWKMLMEFGKYPSTPLYGCTKLTIGENNRIIYQRDYFDMWGDIFNNIPWFHRPYRKFLHKRFG
jgi:limonene-1,2-epoxide hydrolase